MAFKRKSDDFEDSPIAKFIITESNHILDQLPVETSMDMIEFYTDCDQDQVLLFEKVLIAFDAASFGFDALDVYCPEVFHGIWLSFKNAIASREKNDLILFLDVIENIKKLDESLKRLVWINTLEFFSLFKVDFINHKHAQVDFLLNMSTCF